MIIQEVDYPRTPYSSLEMVGGDYMIIWRIIWDDYLTITTILEPCSKVTLVEIHSNSQEGDEYLNRVGS